MSIECNNILFEFWIYANPVAIFCQICHYFAASLDHNHCWSRIILLRLCLVARLEIHTWLNTNVNEYTKQSNAEKSLSVFFLIKVLLCHNYPTMRQNCGGGLFSHLSLFRKRTFGALRIVKHPWKKSISRIFCTRDWGIYEQLPQAI